MRGFDCVAPDGIHADPMHFEAEDDEGSSNRPRRMLLSTTRHSASARTSSARVSQGAYDLEPRSA